MPSRVAHLAVLLAAACFFAGCDSRTAENSRTTQPAATPSPSTAPATAVSATTAPTTAPAIPAFFRGDEVSRRLPFSFSRYTFEGELSLREGAVWKAVGVMRGITEKYKRTKPMADSIAWRPDTTTVRVTIAVKQMPDVEGKRETIWLTDDADKRYWPLGYVYIDPTGGARCQIDPSAPTESAKFIPWKDLQNATDNGLIYVYFEAPASTKLTTIVVMDKYLCPLGRPQPRQPR